MQKEKTRLLKTTLVPAVCIIILLISVAYWKLLFNTTKPNNEVTKDNTQDINIMRVPDNTTLPVPADGEQKVTQNTTVSISLKDLDEAKQYIGNKLLKPSYIPNNFKFKGIQGVSYDNDRKRSVWIEYVSGDKSFVVSVEEESEWKSFDGYNNVDINGLTGHMKAFKDVSSEISEVRWFSGKSMYTVEGAITEEDALKVSRTLN